MRKDITLKRASIASVLAVLSLAIVSAKAAGSFENVKVENFGQINANYLRGAQPKGNDYADLAAAGIRTVIDLTQDGEAGEQRAVESVGMKFHRIELTTHTRPARDQVDTFLEIVNDPANQPVYVHCQGGRHRTGVMTAVYRLTHDGWTPDRAYEEMRKYDFEAGFGHGALKKFVYDYYKFVDQTKVAVVQEAPKQEAAK